MRLRWNNIVAFLLAVPAVVYGMVQHDHICLFLASLAPGARGCYPPDQVVFGLLVLVCVVLGLIALIKIFF